LWAAELFVPVGNPASDYVPDSRPGDNLFTDSVVVLDALIGKLKRYHQFQLNDSHGGVACAPSRVYFAQF